MSYAIVRIQKFSSGSVMGIQIHDKRLKENISHTNKNINWEKTYLNYDLVQADNNNFHKIIKKRIESLNLKRAVRKDAVVMAQCLVTSDKDFFDELTPEKTEKFFQDSYNWLCERYGKENVISATVHIDEKTPHMHFNFIPVTDDGRLSAKSVLTRQSLTELQDLFSYDVGENYGLQRGQEGGNKVHLEVAEYKLETTRNKLEKAKTLLDNKDYKLKEIDKELKIQKNKLLELEKGITLLKDKKIALEQEINIIGYKVLNSKEISSIKPKKGFGGGLKDITIDDINNLKKMSLEYISIKKAFEDLKIDYLKMSNNTRNSLKTLENIAILENKNKKLTKKLRAAESIIEKNPDLKELYISTLEIANKGKSIKGFSR